MREMHPMNGARAGAVLQRAATVLEVTAVSYGLETPVRVLRWTSGRRVGLQQALHGVHDALEGDGLVQDRDVELPEVADMRG